MVLQLWAAGGATLLAVGDRFRAIASAYGAGALAGLIGYVALEGATGERVLGFSMLTMAIVTFADHGRPGSRRVAAPVGRPQRELSGSLHPRALLRCVGSLLGRTGIYLAFNGLYLVTLAFAGRYHTGDATVVSYAYLFSSVPRRRHRLRPGDGARRRHGRERQRRLRDVLATPSRRASGTTMLVSAPATGGADRLRRTAHRRGPAQEPVAATTSSCSSDSRCSWCRGWSPRQLVNLLLPVAFAQGRSRGVNMLAPVLVIAQVVFTAVGAALFGLYGAVGAMCLAPRLRRGDARGEPQEPP